MNVAIARFSRLLLLFVVIVSVYVPVIAQNMPVTTPPRSSGSSSLNLDFKFDESLGNTFYVDMLGLEASQMPFAPEVRVDPTRYILGPNDLIGVIIRGALSLNYRAIGVNVEGDIILPSVGTISVAGLNLFDARDAIRQTVEQEFRNVTVQVSLDKPRPMSVHITGDIPYPGRVSVPYGTRLDVPLLGALLEIPTDEEPPTTGGSLTRGLFPSYFDVPGMSPNSMSEISRNSDRPILTMSDLLRSRKWQFRSIRIKHANGTESFADLFDYYYGGNLDANTMLYDGDQLQVVQWQETDPRVSISGEVNYSLDISFRADDNLARLLRIGGGFSGNADTTRISIYRSSRDGISHIQLSASNTNLDTYALQANDRIVVHGLTFESSNFAASVIGQVDTKGIFPIREGSTTAYDLLRLAGGLQADALPKAAYIARSKSAITNQPELNRHSVRDFMRGSDQMVQGLSWLELEENIRKNRIYLNAANEQQLRSIKVMDGDSLIIPRDLNTVYVYGQVSNPGYVEYQPGASVYDYIDATGGYTLSSDRKKLYLIKAGSLSWADATNSTIESGDMIYVDRTLLDDNVQRRNFLVQRQTFYATLILTISSTTFAILNYLRN